MISPVTKDTVYTEDYVASIQSVQNVDIRTRISGYLDKIHVDEGQNVKKGQLLFSLGDQEFREELAKASAMLKTAIADAKTAEVDLQNTESLVEKNVVSKTALDLANAKLDAAKAGIEEAKAHEATARLRLAYTEIRAPFDGIIDRFPIKAGSVVDEGDLLTSISDSKEVFAYFNFSETEYLDYILSDHSEEKGKVQLVLANNDVYPHKGVIETVEGKINPGTGNIAFRARFPNPESILKHGSSGKVLISQRLNNVLLVPQKCTFEIQGDVYVYTVDDQNTARMKLIRTAFSIPHWYVVESGLQTADKVIFEGIQLVREGDKINPTAVKSEQVIAKR
ncbi:MAG TPA: efflux RND transporter periplasmic adaptor subunit [Cyclobacteriaceae bacterium]|nr:efflux RND transporter periplasmic adaptor subunit [Cyclobacteriaceae bacterium]